ncbi:MAG: DUF1559 domain-containing protein [Planctomycetota bacterium]
MRRPNQPHAKQPHPARRQAFTLVELLVVIAIIGTLVGLLLPAVQSARESARNNTCKNNLKQFHLGMTLYDSSQGELPGYVNELRDPNGVDTSPNNGSVDEAARRASWMVMMFPYIEYGALWDRWSRELPPEVTGSDYDEDSWNELPATVSGVAPEIELAQCPSDPVEGEGLPFLSYVVNAGQAADAGESSRGTEPITDFVIPARDNANAEVAGNGVFFDLAKNLDVFPADDFETGRPINVSVSYVQANDGTTRTMMISENLHAVYWAYDGADAGDSFVDALDDSQIADAKHLFGFVWHNSVSGNQNLRRINGAINELTPEGLAELRGRPELGYPSSQHPGGVNVVFVDGHIVFVNERVNNRVYSQLMTSNRKRSKYYDVTLTANANATDRKLPQPSDADL